MDPIEKAVRSATAGPRGRLPFKLSTGRSIVVELPLPISPEEVIEAMTILPSIALELNRQLLARSGAKTLETPGGQVTVLPRSGVPS